MARQSEQSCQISNVQNNVLEFKNINVRFKTNIQQLEKEKKEIQGKKSIIIIFKFSPTIINILAFHFSKVRMTNKL